jgi:hypothetical protein
MINDKNDSVHRMLKYQDDSTFYSSPYSVGIEDMNQDWHNAQMAWRLLGFYVDCNYNSDSGVGGYQEKDMDQKKEKGHDREHRRMQHQEKDDREKDDGPDRDHKDGHNEANHNDYSDDEGRSAKPCMRKTMYAVVSIMPNKPN